MASIKKNFLYSSLLTVSSYLFPLITYPYVSRTLGVSNIGICNFVDSIIHYFILFSMLGVNAIGIREIAANKGDKHKLSSCFCNLVAFNFCMTMLISIILCLVILFISQLQAYRNMLWIGMAKLWTSVFVIEWFYKGMEDFRYITLRSILVNILFIIAIFAFVRNKDDYAIYYLLSACICAVTVVINWRHLLRFVTLSFRDLDILYYAKSLLTMGSYLLLTFTYTSFNVMFLGFVAGDTEVGLYTTATKLFSFILALFTAFTGVMLPRMSALIKEGKRDEFDRLTTLSTSILAKFVFPLILFSVLYAPEIINIISGPSFAQAVLPMRIVMPLLFIIGYEQILIIQILMPLKKDKAILANSIIGTLVGLSLNIIFVPYYKSVGAALVWVSSECAVLLSAQCFIHKYLNQGFPFKLFLKELYYSSPILIFLAGAHFLPCINIVKMSLSAIILTGYYSLAFIRNERKQLA